MISECSDHPIVIKIDALLHFSKDWTTVEWK